MSPERIAHILWWLDACLLALGGLIALGWLVGVGCGGRDPLRGSPLRPNRIGLVAVWVCIVAYLVAGSVGSSLGQWLAPRSISEEQMKTCRLVIGTTFGSLIAAGVCLMVGRAVFREGWRGLGIGRRSWRFDVTWAPPAAFASMAACSGVAWVTEKAIRLFNPQFEPPAHNVFQTLHDPAIPAWIHVLAFEGALLLAPVSEELLFRGFLQTALRRVIEPRRRSLRHRWIAIAITGAIFGAMHDATPQHVPALILFGLILGYLYERTGSLRLTMLVHLLFNGKSLLWDGLLRL